MTKTPAADIVERLRKIDAAARRSDGSQIPLGEHLTEAATEIEALRAREAELTGFDLIPEGEHAKALIRIDALQSQRERLLVQLYHADPVWAAAICDDELDRSGNLLGRVRAVADRANATLASIRGETD